MEHTETETPAIPQKIFEVQTYSFDDAGNDTVEKDTVQGYLAVTPDFIAVTDDVGRVTFYTPSHRVKKVFATGDVPVTTSLATTVPSGLAN